MNRLLIALPTLTVLGCAAPKAIVVEEPDEPKTVVRNTTETDLPGPETGLRDPDVLSDLPEGQSQRSPGAVTSAEPTGSPTVIARPPSEPAADKQPATGTN